MTSRLTTFCLGAAVALGVGAATPASAAPLPAVKLDTAGVSGAQVYKVHRFRGRRHCERRWAPVRGWHRHRAGCEYQRYWRPRRPGPGWTWRDRDGCWWHPRWGLRCQF